MQIENEFEVAAPPERVYAFLLDVNRIVNCMPGAELSEVVDPNTFNGKVKIKVGPITVSYKGTARISERDESAHRATLQAEGRETTGPGSARATAVMTVEPADSGSRVRLATDFNVAGRVANFGRGVMEDVSRRLINQMAACIKSNLEAAEAQEPEEEPEEEPAAAAPGGNEPPRGAFQPPAAATSGQPAPMAEAGPRSDAAPAESPPSTPAPLQAASKTAPAAAKPVNALSLFFAILWDRIKRLFGRG